jgi:hypothetical protein
MQYYASGGLAPLAAQLQSRGRGEDTMLVHMTPGEVNGLQELAMAHGGSLTTNPDTGLPEAGWLGKLLPTILGIAGSFIGIPPMLTAAAVGAGTGIVKGDLKAGLMAGLQAYGGSSLGSALNSATTALPTVASNVPTNIAPLANVGLTQTPATLAAQMSGLTPTAVPSLTSAGFGAAAPQAAARLAVAAPQAGAGLNAIATAPQIAASGMRGFTGPSSNFMGDFAAASRRGLPGGTPNMVRKFAPQIAGMGLMSALSDASQPNFQLPPEAQQKSTYGGPYVPQQRTLRMPTKEEREALGSAEWNYFTPSNPVPGYRPLSSLSPEERQQYGYAEGGDVIADIGGVPDSGLAALFGATAPFAQQNYSQFQGAPLGGYVPFGGATPPGDPSLSQGYSPYRGSGIYADPTMAPQTRADSPLPTYQTFKGRTSYNPAIAVDPASISKIADAYRNTSPPPITNFTAPPEGGSGTNLGGVPVPGTSTPDTSTPVISTPDTSTPATSTPATSTPATAAPPPRQLTYFEMYPDVAAEFYAQQSTEKGRRELAKIGATTPEGFTAFHYGTFGQFENRVSPSGEPPAPAPTYSDPYSDYGQPAAPAGPDFAAYAASYPDLAAAAAAAGQDLYTFGAQHYANHGADEGRVVPGMRRGGSVDMHNGSFVLDARTVSEIGNGSSNAGRELLARMGGQPVNGPGDGVSDSVRAKIGGVQDARVARDEVIMPPEVVRRLGKGSPRRGADKLYAMMDRAHKARKSADRGQDTGLRRGLG